MSTDLILATVAEPANGDSAAATQITALRGLAAREVQQIRKAEKVLFALEQQLSLFEIVKLNFEAVGRLFATVLRSFVERQPLSMTGIIIDANRHILNFLTSMRTFVDHMRTRLSRSRDPSIVARFDRWCSAEYDRYFSFRFITRLRNYAQHCGMPVGHVRLRASDEPSESGGTSFAADGSSITISFAREELLSNFDGWSTVRRGLAHQPPLMEIGHHLSIAFAGVNRIHHRAALYSFRRARDDVRRLRKLVDECNEAAPGQKPIYGRIQRQRGRAGDAIQLSFNQLNVPMIQHVLEVLGEDS